MKKRIFKDMMLLAIFGLLIISAALCVIFYNQISKNVQDELRQEGRVFKDATAEIIKSEFAFELSHMRITLINPEGIVEYDNAAAVADMENHKERAEIKAALEGGFGESRRYSATIGQETFYYAIRLKDGYILRFAKTTSSIWGIIMGAIPTIIPVVLMMCMVCYLTAGSLTKRVFAPLDSIDLSGKLTAPYDELAPFIKTIAEQREHMAGQLCDLQSRTDTINAIMDNINEGIILINEDGIILSANKSILRIFENASPLDGKNILEILRDVSFSGHVRNALADKPGEMVMELAGRAYRVYFSHVRGGGAIILFLDTTEKAKAEKLRREFSANVSHELKTPLTAIYGHIEMLAGGMVKENDKQAFYDQIKNEAGRMIALIEDILMISKLDESGGQESFAKLELAAVAAEAVESLSQKAAKNSVAVTVSADNASMRANRSLLYEMFYNLIDNAIKYNKQDGKVTIDIRGADSQIKIAISDTGIGIPKESQTRVFERFYRVDKSRSKKTGGTGLGLAIVKHIVMVHDGEIELKSRENEGTTITITFSSAP